MPGDRVAKGLQERREGAIEVVAVTASPGDDSLDRLGRVNAGRPSELDIDVLVRNPLDLGPMQCEQRLDRRLAGMIEAEAAEVCEKPARRRGAGHQA